MGDKAYSSAANRAYLRRRGIKAVIPVKEDQKSHRCRFGGRPPAFDNPGWQKQPSIRIWLRDPSRDLRDTPWPRAGRRAQRLHHPDPGRT
jgi:hypothetical protein